MRVTLSDNTLGIRAHYDIDPIDLIVRARQGDYEVCLQPWFEQLCRIVVEASANERATFDVVRDRPGVFRIFLSTQELARDLARCLPQLAQYLQEPGAVFYTQVNQQLQKWSVERLAELARKRTVKEFVNAV